MDGNSVVAKIAMEGISLRTKGESSTPSFGNTKSYTPVHAIDSLHAKKESCPQLPTPSSWFSAYIGRPPNELVGCRTILASGPMANEALVST
jgi:hypothetical protein